MFVKLRVPHSFQYKGVPRYTTAESDSANSQLTGGSVGMGSSSSALSFHLFQRDVLHWEKRG